MRKRANRTASPEPASVSDTALPVTKKREKVERALKFDGEPVGNKKVKKGIYYYFCLIVFFVLFFVFCFFCFFLKHYYNNILFFAIFCPVLFSG